MHARITTAEVRPGLMDEFVAIVQASQAEAHNHADARQGHRETHVLVDREKNKVVAIGLWETEEGMRASMASSWNQAMAERLSPLMVAPPHREFFEVAVSRSVDQRSK